MRDCYGYLYGYGVGASPTDGYGYGYGDGDGHGRLRRRRRQHAMRINDRIRCPGCGINRVWCTAQDGRWLCPECDRTPAWRAARAEHIAAAIDAHHRGGAVERRPTWETPPEARFTIHEGGGS